MIAKSYALTIPLLGIHSWDTSAHTHSKIKTIKYLWLHLFLHEVATISTGIIHQRKSKPNKLGTHQKETENWQLGGQGGGHARMVGTLFFL